MINKDNIPEVHQSPSLSTDPTTNISRYSYIPEGKKCNIVKHKDSLYIYGENFDYTKIRLPLEIIDLFNELLEKNDSNLDISKFKQQIKEIVNEHINTDNIELQIEEILNDNILEYLKKEIDISDMLTVSLNDYINESIDLDNLLEKYLENYDIKHDINDFCKDELTNIIDDHLNRLNIKELISENLGSSAIEQPTDRLDSLEKKLSEIDIQQNGLSKKEEQSLVDKITAKIKKELQIENGIGNSKPSPETLLFFKEKGLTVDEIVTFHKNGLI